MSFEFNPPDGLRNTVDFPTKPPSETALRDSFQDLLDQLRDELNSGSFSAAGIANMARQAAMNGEPAIWQRGASFTNPASGSYTADRYLLSFSADSGVLPTTLTHSRLSTSNGEVPGSYYAYRLQTDGAGSGFGANASYGLFHRIEKATRYLCGASRKLSISFWARSSIPGKRVGISFSQRYGSGGSPTAAEQILGQVFTLTSTWTKYTVTIDTNTLNGKTFGTNNDDYFQIGLFFMWGTNIGTGQFVSGGTAESFVGSGTIDFSQLQVNSGASALPYQPRSFADELTLCQRYYEKSYDYGTSPGTATSTGSFLTNTLDNTSAGVSYAYMSLIRKRIAPTVTIYGTGGTINTVNDGTADRAIGAGSFATAIGDKGFQQNYTLTGATAALRKWHYTADAEI